LAVALLRPPSIVPSGAAMPMPWLAMARLRVTVVPGWSMEMPCSPLAMASFRSTTAVSTPVRSMPWVSLPAAWFRSTTT
jgi:hypothetical protein